MRETLCSKMAMDFIQISVSPNVSHGLLQVEESFSQRLSGCSCGALFFE